MKRPTSYAPRDARLRAKAVAEVRAVAAVAAKHLHIPEHILVSRNRTARVAKARAIASYVCHERLGKSLSLIGEAFNRDHSSIYHGVRQVQDEIESRSAPKWLVEAVESIARVVTPIEAVDASEGVVSAYFALNAKQRRAALARIAAAEAGE